MLLIRFSWKKESIKIPRIKKKKHNLPGEPNKRNSLREMDDRSKISLRQKEKSFTGVRKRARNEIALS